MGNMILLGLLDVAWVELTLEPRLMLRYWSPVLKRYDAIDWPVEDALTGERIIHLGWLSNLLNGIAIVVRLDHEQLKHNAGMLAHFTSRHRAWRVERGFRDEATVSCDTKPPRMTGATTTKATTKAAPAAKPATTPVKRATQSGGRRSPTKTLGGSKRITSAADLREAMVKAG